MKIAAKPPTVIEMRKSIFYPQLEMTLYAAYELAPKAMIHGMDRDEAKGSFDTILTKMTPKWSFKG